MRALWRGRAAGAALALVALPAHAHLVETGFGGFYDGIAHLLVTPEDILVVLALALLAGLKGAAAGRLAALALPLAWLAGGLVGTHWSAGSLPLVSTASFALIGLLVALDARLRPAGVLAFSVVAGVLHGLVNGATMAPGGADTLALIGAVSGVAFVATVLAAEISALPVGWPRIVVRVAGSWIAATGVLMFGWMARLA